MGKERDRGKDRRRGSCSDNGGERSDDRCVTAAVTVKRTAMVPDDEFDDMLKC